MWSAPCSAAICMNEFANGLFAVKLNFWRLHVPEESLPLEIICAANQPTLNRELDAADIDFTTVKIWAEK